MNVCFCQHKWVKEICNVLWKMENAFWCIFFIFLLVKSFFFDRLWILIYKKRIFSNERQSQFKFEPPIQYSLKLEIRYFSTYFDMTTRENKTFASYISIIYLSQPVHIWLLICLNNITQTWKILPELINIIINISKILRLFMLLLFHIKMRENKHSLYHLSLSLFLSLSLPLSLYLIKDAKGKDWIRKKCLVINK